MGGNNATLGWSHDFCSSSSKKKVDHEREKREGRVYFQRKKINMMVKITYIHIISTGNDS
jgi:hypothetical protein